MLQSTPMASVSTMSVFDLSADAVPIPVREFAVRRGLLSSLQEALVLASRTFDISVPISLSVEEDPDTGESWLEMRVAARGDVEEVMRAHEEYINRSLCLPSTSSRQIRLFLHMVEA